MDFEDQKNKKTYDPLEGNWMNVGERILFIDGELSNVEKLLTDEICVKLIEKMKEQL
jgi:hypothetical protein